MRIALAQQGNQETVYRRRLETPRLDRSRAEYPPFSPLSAHYSAVLCNEVASSVAQLLVLKTLHQANRH